MISVVHTKKNLDKGKPWSVYIGRPKPLGNIFLPAKYGREECIGMFHARLKEALSPEPVQKSKYLTAMRQEFYRLVYLYKKYNKLVLECWCSPLPCHGDVIKQELEKFLGVGTV